jgi:hypothetical protein
MEAMTKQRVLKTLEQLPEKETEQLIDYLDFLVWKSKQQKSEPKQTGKNPIAQKIVEAMKEPPHLTEDDIQALLQAIDEGKQPIQFESPFDEIGELEQQ